MNNEIKVNKANKSITFINNGIAFSQFGVADEILDLITNLEQENERLKQKLNCKEYFSSTMPENTEFVILTKNNYDRQQKDIELELIDYKSRNEKAIPMLKELNIKLKDILNIGIGIKEISDIENVLNGRSDE